MRHRALRRGQNGKRLLTHPALAPHCGKGRKGKAKRSSRRILGSR